VPISKMSNRGNSSISPTELLVLSPAPAECRNLVRHTAVTSRIFILLAEQYLPTRKYQICHRPYQRYRPRIPC